MATSPERWVYGLSLGAWALLALGPGPVAGAGSGSGSGHHGHSHASQGAWATNARLFLIMVAAMMLPLVAPAVRHIGRTSLWRHRHRSSALYVVGFAAVWVVFASAVSTVQALLGVPGSGTGWIAVTAAVAAGWQQTKWRRSVAARCGERPVLPVRGWRCAQRSVGAGWRYGCRCLILCGPSMLIMAATHQLPLMLAVFAIHAYERRRGPNPFAEQRRHVPAAAYALIAGAAAVVATLAV
jgi:hypothetical protein